MALPTAPIQFKGMYGTGRDYTTDSQLPDTGSQSQLPQSITPTPTPTPTGIPTPTIQITSHQDGSQVFVGICQDLETLAEMSAVVFLVIPLLVYQENQMVVLSLVHLALPHSPANPPNLRYHQDHCLYHHHNFALFVGNRYPLSLLNLQDHSLHLYFYQFCIRTKTIYNP
jgi:hypothetical protein